MLKHILKFSWVFALLTIGFFTACTEDEITTEETTEEFVDQAIYALQTSGSIGNSGCYELVFPITIEFSDNTTVVVNDYDEMIDAIRTWKEANPGVGFENRPQFVFPIEVISDEGELISVADHSELRQLREDCGWRPRPGHHGHHGHSGHCQPCFELIFPITVQFPDDTTAEATDREALKDLIRDWFINNPGTTDHPQIVFPIEAELEDGTVVTVNDLDELIALKDSCD